MFRNLFGFLLCVWCVCIAGVAFAEDDVQVSEPDPSQIEIMRQSARLELAQQGDTSPEIFEDIEYLQGLLQRLNWENSQDQTRKGLYNKLSQAVESIKSLEAQELKEKYQIAQDAKEIEKSFENRMLGAAAIGTIGLGAMQLASGLAEQKADEDAETAMRAYLATFTCEYGSGRISGGSQNNELPGSNVLTPLVIEYKTLASDLKARKEALGLKPGIESEVILDSATAGLYDDKNVGKTGGAYTSLSRALSGNAEDAAAWDAQKEATAKKVDTSKKVVAAAVVASVAANLAINGGRKNVVSQTKEIRDEVKAILDEIIDNCNNAIAADQDALLQGDFLTGYEDLEKLEGHAICK